MLSACRNGNQLIVVSNPPPGVMIAVDLIKRAYKRSPNQTPQLPPSARISPPAPRLHSPLPLRSPKTLRAFPTLRRPSPRLQRENSLVFANPSQTALSHPL